MKIQKNGTILNAGGFAANFSLARLTSVGQLDTTFGSGGKIRQNLPGSFETINRLTILSNGGNILAAGYSRNAQSNQRIAVERFTSTGNVDTTFASNGIFYHDIPSSQPPNTSMALSTDGSILIGASSFAFSDLDQAIIPKPAPIRAIDKTFAANGTFSPSPPRSIQMQIPSTN